MEKDKEVINHVLICGVILDIAWGTKESHTKPHLLADIYALDLPNTHVFLTFGGYCCVDSCRELCALLRSVV
jgi:hypothetical protein